jgi:hypothetical protein
LRARRASVGGYSIALGQVEAVSSLMLVCSFMVSDVLCYRFVLIAVSFRHPTAAGFIAATNLCPAAKFRIQ